jgi:hypothetical protein
MITTSAAPRLSPYQAGRVDRARQALAQDRGPEVEDLAYRIGRLEWWLADMLSLVDQLTGQDG